MAFTSTFVRKTVIGNLRMEIWTYSAASVTTGTVTSNLSQVEAVAWTPKTQTASAVIDWTTTNGAAALTGLTTSDTGVIIFYGKK